MSQFAGLFKALKNDGPPIAESSTPTEETPARAKSQGLKNVAPAKRESKATNQNKKPESIVTGGGSSKTSVKKAETKAAPVVEENIKRYRGKSSNPEYTQVLAYIQKKTYKEVKRSLLDDPEQDFSELIENLLSQWLTSKI